MTDTSHHMDDESVSQPEHAEPRLPVLPAQVVVVVGANGVCVYCYTSTAGPIEFDEPEQLIKSCFGKQDQKLIVPTRKKLGLSVLHLCE